MALIRELHRPDLALLPIGGHFTMDPTAAALAVELLGVKDVVPIHYGTYPILAGTPDQLREALSARGLGDVTVMRRIPASRSGPAEIALGGAARHRPCKVFQWTCELSVTV